MSNSSRRTGRITATVAAVLIGLVIVAYSFYQSPFQRIKRHGYSSAEARLMLERIPEDDLPSILRHAYLPSLVEILQDPAFSTTHISNYLAIMTTTDFTPEQIIALGNHVDFDQDEVYTSDKYDILMQPYYLSNRRERYFVQLQSQTESSLTVPEIVTLVNANRDRDYYAEPKPASTAQTTQMLVNKYYYLAPDYSPELVVLDAQYGSPGLQLDIETYAHFQEMYAAALAADYQLYVTSAYRDYDDQVTVFDGYMMRMGEADALEYAAKPGFSEHQTGYALDIFVPGATIDSFQDHPAAHWLAEHAHEYGFILRYPEGKENITGYNYEAWHYRYVGAEAANIIYDQGLTYEEYWAYFVDR